MFKVAVDAISNTDISKVLILERIPRFDRIDDDPFGLKRDLSDLANDHLHELLQNSKFRNQIFIGKHSFGISSVIRNDLYGRGLAFDGINLKGPAGQHFYTKSFLKILRESGLFGTKLSSPSSSSSSRESLGSSERRNKYSEDHTDCKQASYQCLKEGGHHDQHRNGAPILFRRGNIKNSFYNRNIFDTFNLLNMSEN